MSKFIAQEEERLTFERLASENHLGLLKETYTAKVSSILWIVYTLFIFALVLLAIWGAITSHDPAWVRIVGIVLLSGFAALILWLTYGAYLGRFNKTLLYEYGMIDKTPEGFQVVRWEQIYYIKKSVIYTQYASGETYEIHLRNGKTLTFRSDSLVSNIESLMRTYVENG
jgi:energy-coupling factor transporter transmembrane protein EcfT